VPFLMLFSAVAGLLECGVGDFVRLTAGTREPRSAGRRMIGAAGVLRA
jgi:hypothetical protein